MAIPDALVARNKARHSFHTLEFRIKQLGGDPTLVAAAECAKADLLALDRAVVAIIGDETVRPLDGDPKPPPP